MRNIFIFLSLIVLSSPSFAGKPFNYTGTWLRQLSVPPGADPEWVMKIEQDENTLSIEYPYSRLRFNRFKWNQPNDAIDIVYRDENIEIRHYCFWRTNTNGALKDEDFYAEEEILDRKTGKILSREFFRIEGSFHPHKVVFKSSANYDTEIVRIND